MSMFSIMLFFNIDIRNPNHANPIRANLQRNPIINFSSVFTVCIGWHNETLFEFIHQSYTSLVWVTEIKHS